MVEGPQIVNLPFWVGVMTVLVARGGPHLGARTRGAAFQVFTYLSAHRIAPGAFRCGGQTVPGARWQIGGGHPENRRQPL